MQKIREKSALLLVALGLAMMLFIVGPDLIQRIGGGAANTAGEIYGEEISIMEFNQLYQQNTQFQSPQTDAERYMLQDQTWEQLVVDKILGREYDRVGVQVTSKELYEMFVGPNISPFLMQIPQFQEPGVGFSVERVQQFLQAAASGDPQFAEVTQFISNLEDYLLQQRRYEKYFNMIKAGQLVSAEEAKRDFLQSNKRFDIQYFAVNYAVIPDSEVQVTDADLQAYLDEHRAQFDANEEVDIVFVKFDKFASAQDTSYVLEQIQKYKADFSLSKDDSSYVMARSDMPTMPQYKPLEQIDPMIADQVAGMAKDSVAGPILTQAGYKIFKISDIMDDTLGQSVKFRHILLPVQGADTSEAYKEAQRIRREASDENWEQMVNLHSHHFETRPSAGNVGWYKWGSFGPQFDARLRNAEAGQTVVIRSPRGYHVVDVLDTQNKLYQVSEVVKTITPSTATNTAIYKEANKFASTATEMGDVEAAATELGKVTRPVTISPENMDITGLNAGRPLANWAMRTEEGAVSEVLDAGNAYVVASIKRKEGSGAVTVEDVREIITPAVTNRKKAEILISRVSELPQGDLNALKTAYEQKYGPGSFLNSAAGVTFNAQNIPGMGPDNKMIGIITGMQEGQTSKPVKGSSGVYVVQVTKVTEPAEVTDADIMQRKQTLKITKTSTMDAKVFNGLKDIADVKDLRYNFDM